MRLAFVCLTIGASLACTGCSSKPDEKIEEFNVVITVRADGTVVVDEEIKVQVAGKKIKRGIYREALNKHRGQTCQIEVLKTWRDGVSVPFIVENRGERTRIRIVRDAGLLSHGPHTFRLKYEVQNRLTVEGNERTLDWNVTGIRWSFPIDGVSASVKLPELIDRVEGSAKFRKGSENSPGIYDPEKNTVRFATSKVVNPGDGFGIHVSWTQD